jgi:integrase
LNAVAQVVPFNPAASFRGPKHVAKRGKTPILTPDWPMHRLDVLRMIKRRAKAAGLPGTTCCHTFRATGITAYLENRGTIENAQAIAAHESPRTTKLYDRRSDEITLDEVEKIAI